MTVSEYGVANSDLILKEVLSQKIDYIDFGFENFLFMEITMNQNQWSGSDVSNLAPNQYCKVLIVYNKSANRYYKVTETNTADVYVLISDIRNNESDPLVFLSKKDLVTNIDLLCIFNFVDNKVIRPFNCLSACRE
ncbi:hypothetical protein [uncultured Nonlabens sp.]|uniref:hypothetical protein n=1 Tax=uncultured Nonlabens sp. TaxID=859306 RepID=UPI0030D8B5CF